MRRVDSEGLSQSSRPRKRGHARTSPAQKSTLRRLALEALEQRTLLSTGGKSLVSTLPGPVTQAQSFVGSGITSGAANSSSPSVAVDPLNPLKLVAAWTTYDPANKLDGSNGQVTAYVQGAYSTDGGATWSELPGDLDADIQTDFSVAPVTGGVQPNFTQTTDATVAFGRDESVYMLSSTHSGTGGVLDLQRWDFTSLTPAQQTFNVPAYDGLSNVPTTINPIYRWQAADAALTPTLAVDNNARSFTDGKTAQSDPFSGNVYVSWETQDAAPKNVTQNPNTIKLMASSDQGQNFTYQAYLNGHAPGNLFDLPKIAISQGSATVPGGQVTIVYDNAGQSTVAPYFDTVQSQASTTGGTDVHGDSPTNVPIRIATLNGGGQGIDTPATTVIPIPVSTASDPNFTSLQDLTLTLSLQYPTLGNTSAVLVAPDGTSATLWTNATNAAGQATNAFGTLTGANVGASTLTPFIGTVLDSTANRSLFDGNVTAPYTGHFRPLANLVNAFQNATLDGTWTLRITDFRNETATTPKQLIGASIDITSGNSNITTNAPSFVTEAFLNSGAHTYTDGIQAVPVLADPSIASDNTLGSFSPHQGRLYIALANDNFNAASFAYTSSTFIELWFSDDGAATWSYGGIVNDDSGLADGFSTGGYAQPGSGVGSSNPPLASDSYPLNPLIPFYGDLHANVRPKIEPQVAVDQDTGTLVVSFFDTRNDASSLRVANYIAASTDGGATFAPETYANPISNFDQSPVIDAITGLPVNLGPIPDNESSGSNNQETTFGFGQRQGLAVADGHVIPVWASNQNAGSKTLNAKVSLNIESARVNFAAGPRVLSSTQGPVGLPGDAVNTAVAADGSPIANTIVFTFDRAVDPSSFPADGPTNPIGTSPLEVFYNNPSGTAPPVPLRVLTVAHDATDTVYTITFDPAGNGVGTYSYTLRPLVKGQVPFLTTLTTDQTGQIPFIDTAANGGQASFTLSGHPGQMLTTATLAAKVDVYKKGASTGSPTDLQIFLVAQDGTRYSLFSGTTQGQAQGVAFDVSNSIVIPAVPAELLDQTYTILVVDSVPGEQVFLFNDVDANDFNFQVTLNNETSGVVTGNFLDQNANGTPGEDPGDAYSVPNTRNSLPLIVPGPHVLATGVTGVGGATSTGTDNLVVNDTVNSLNVTFDRDMRVSSFTPAQVLSIVGPTGRIDSPQTFPSTGTSKTFAYNGAYQPIPKAGTLTSTILIANTGLTVSSLTVQVNVTDPNDQSLQLVLMAPDGTMVPLVNNGTAAGANFTNTTFSDVPPANGLASTIPGGAAPYSLTYQPASPLGALAGKVLDGTWKLLITDGTAAGPQGRLNAWSLNVTPQVPKGTGTKLDSSLVIASYPDNSFKIGHLAVQVTITSTMDSDLQVYLVAPDGTTTIPLILNAGGSGGSNANFINTVLDDNGTIPIASGAAPFSLTYKPVGSLSTLDGLSIEGTWTLRIINPNADTSTSTLLAWSLIATPQLTVTPVNPTAGGTAARTFTVGFPTQQLSGNYNITLSPNILSVTANPADPSQGTPLDTNLNAGVDALRGTPNGVTTPEKFAATAVPVTIPYAKKNPIGTTNGVLNSQVSVTDNFAIQGDVGTLAGLTVSLNISYYYDPDLTVTLTAPDGKSVTLFMNVGKGGNTADFTNTTLSDTVNPPAPITAAGAPFFGTFNPEFPLAAFATDLNGNQAFSQGLWTLTIVNIGQDPGPAVDTVIPPALLSWSLTFQKPQPSTGLGEAVADQATVGFRLFNLAPTNPLANDTWTAVGPAGTSAAANPNNLTHGAATGANLGGPVSVVAFDPSDPSGNTAFIGAASGGVWKTNDFLTTAAGGPTYLPLTDFGANYTVNIGGIAIFPRNNDSNQSIVFAGTGDGEATTSAVGNSSQGVGILRSTNGGASFTLLDSSVNVDANGNPLPIGSPLRDHVFVGTTTYKVVVDPTLSTTGGVIVYAALGGKNGGLWRSIDGGNHWANLSAGVVPQVGGQNASATDVLLDPASRSASTGNLDILYAAFQGVGVYISSNQGQSLAELLGTVGATNLIQSSGFIPAKPLTVNDANTPNGAFGRIILAKPALTDNAAQNILYQDWLYVAVENTNGTFHGLYITKDRGENWTNAKLTSNVLPGPPTVTEALPTNDNTQANTYDVTASQNPVGRVHDGNSAFSLAVDPANPDIVYLGGTQDYNTSGLIRVDLTGIYDAHAYVPFANDRNDGGQLALDSTGRVNVLSIAAGLPFYQGTNPSDPSQQTGDFYVNLRHNPNDPFNTNATLFVYNSTLFTNDGTGVKWTPLDTSYDLPLDGSTNIHQMFTIVDPLTGLTRLIVADDQGVFTGLLHADGTLDTTGIGTDAAVNGSRNGNLQAEEIYYSAAQPSALAAQAAGALFYASGVGLTDVQSPSNLLSTGNLTWTVQGVAYGDVQAAILSNDRGGTGIATDQTGGVSATNPNGSPSLYEYDVPFLGGDTTNFFRVQNNGQTTGLVNNFPVEFPANNVLTVGNGVSQLGNFTVNPINGSQVLISSNLGNVYETTNKGIQWLQIGAGQAVGTGKADFDGTYAPALAYGAPDPAAPNGVGNLDNFIYVGTVGGHAYVTQTGAGPWTPLSAGLDGSSIVSIFTNPNRGSREAYAVTLKGVYYMANSIASASNPNPTWVNITGNLAQIQHNSFGDITLAQNSLLNYANGQLGGFRSIVADYRYAVPDPVLANVTYPVLYVAGYGGVFRSLDNGQSWTAFPNTAFDSAPIDGGYLPQVDVTDLVLNLGAVNPATGHATQVAGDPEVLLASTLGRGDFAIRLAPDVFPTTIHLDPILPAPGGSDSGVSNTDRITNVLLPYIDGISEISNFGNVVTITLTDASNGDVLGTGTTDPFGRFSIQLSASAQQTDPSFFLSSTSLNDKVVGIQATDSSGARGNVTDFRYTLISTTPSTPTTPFLEAKYDTGRSNSDDVTNIEIPAPTPGATPVFVAPVFDVTTTPPPAGLSAVSTVELLRSTSPSGPFTVVGSTIGTGGLVMISDASLQALAQAGPLNGIYYYESDQIDQAGNVSSRSAALAVTVITTTPPTLPAPTLDPSTNTGLVPGQNVTDNTHPVFDATGLAANDQLFLYRSTNGAQPILVGTAAVGLTQVMDSTGAIPDGVYLYQVVQADVAGNVSNYSPSIAVTINTRAPAVPTLALLPADDSGLPLHPNVTNVRQPRVFGTAPYNSGGSPNFPLDILLVNGNVAAGVVIASTFPAANGTYQVAIASPLPDGTYTLVARTRNLAGTPSYSAPLVLTIKANGPQITPTLIILPADDTGIKGDGVTANHHPRFTGITDPGDTVTLYALVNGVLSAPEATATSSTINGSFTLQLPFNLTDGSTQLFARTTDIAGNTGPLSAALPVRIITVAGDYYQAGFAQIAIFDPNTESYFVRGGGSVSVDPTSHYRDVPVQYDFNGDGAIDFTGYRFDTATYFGLVSTNSTINTQYGLGGVSLPVSGYFGPSGTFIYANYGANSAYWVVGLPQPGGLAVKFVVPQVDIPTPGAFDGGGVSEITAFRPVAIAGGDADSFSVGGPRGYYQVSFTNPAIAATAKAAGFVYQTGDIPAPADYDGVGRDEFAIYRPSTGQFFILNTPNSYDSSTWTMRAVKMNLPGGPNAKDVPVSEDYDGNGKVDPSVYRPSNSTFYVLHSSSGIQEAIPFGLGNFDIAPAGPLLYRLTALQGPYASNGGYPTPNRGGGSAIGGGGTGAFSLHAAALNSSPSSNAPVSSLIALAAPIALSTPTVPTVPVTTGPASASAPTSTLPVSVGASTPKPHVKTVATPKPHATAKDPHHPKVDTTRKPTKPLTVDTKSHAVEAKAPAVESKAPAHHQKAVTTTVKKHVEALAAVAALQHLVLAKKGQAKA